jgi:hypothetical protein
MPGWAAVTGGEKASLLHSPGVAGDEVTLRFARRRRHASKRSRPSPAWLQVRHSEHRRDTRPAARNAGRGQRSQVLLAVEESTDVPLATEDRTRHPDLLWVAHRVFPFCQCTPLHADRPRRRSATRIGSSPPSGNGTRRTTEGSKTE